MSNARDDHARYGGHDLTSSASVVGIARIPRGAPGTVPARAPKPPADRDLPITVSQAGLLANLQGAVSAAQDRVNAAVSAILGGHDIERAQVVRLAGTPERPVLVVRVAPVKSGEA